MARRNTKPHECPQQDIDRFFSHVKKTERCWLWQAYCFKNGYGSFGLGDKTYYAHRVSYAIAFGEIPDDKCVMHDCDRFYEPRDITYRKCIRPDHLFLGTKADNYDDMVVKGRDNNRMNTVVVRGEQHYRAKLTEAQVLDIRAKAAAGQSRTSIANELGLPYTTVSNIVARRKWKHLP